jgi:molybdopterin converting factor small subunit
VRRANTPTPLSVQATQSAHARAAHYDSDVTLTVLLFASWADALGSSVRIDLPEGARVRDLLASVSALAAGRPLPTPVVAVNQRYAKADAELRASDEVALIPPVAGG